MDPLKLTSIRLTIVGTSLSGLAILENKNQTKIIIG